MVKFVGFFEMLVVDAKGSAGDICVIWKIGVSLHQNEFNENPITVEVSDAICNWLLVDFYGPPYATKKKKAWKNLTALLESYHGPWDCLGDFNFTANDSEILGGSKGGSSATNYLKDLIIEFGAIDLGCSGKKAWIENVSGFAMVKLCKKQDATRDTLTKWNKEVFGHCQNSINELLSKIAEVQNKPFSEQNGIIEGDLITELSEWLIRSEETNRIDGIKHDDGTWVTGSNQIRQHFLNTFKDLFEEEEVSFLNDLDNLIPPCITKTENLLLRKVLMPEEIKSTIFNMHDTKAPGPNGFPSLFYKKYWPIVGDTMIQVVTSFFEVGTMPKEVNNSLIVLIPKIVNPSTTNNSTYQPLKRGL
ncbi:uncharacterized protein LOC142640172 [Castanea sativa]|uniref:uncharacterized protein LOC142640172 n=1 Tax=Castanea sativa TaxID=21020 RepID=UPI003F64E154